MAGETVLTVIGNATADAELRYTSTGAATASFTVASTPRVFDKQSGEYRDGDALFMRVNVWREQAESVAETVKRGMRLVVSGRLKQRSYETSAGEKRTVVELEADEVAVSLKYATATVTKTARAGRDGGGSPAHGRSGTSGGGGGDPWGSVPTGGAPVDDEPPW